MKKKRKTGAAALAAAVLIIAVLAANRNLIYVIWHNLYSPAVKMEDSREWTGGASYERLPYSDVSESDYLNLYVPKSEEPMPLLILVHGGGFVSNDCESRQAQFMYRYFRDQGYACASVNYRLAQEAAYPAAIEDVKAAVRFLRANAENYGYDAERFAIWGESAGGYLAAMAAVTADGEFDGVPFIGEEKRETPVSGAVSALLDYYGIMDFDLAEQDFKAEKKPSWLIEISQLPLNRNLEGYDTVEDMWLQKAVGDCTEEELEALSPRSYITRNVNADTDLNVLILHGDVDLSVACTQSERLADAFREALGEERVSNTLKKGYRHADDRFYREDQMEETHKFLDSTLGF